MTQCTSKYNLANIQIHFIHLPLRGIKGICYECDIINAKVLKNLFTLKILPEIEILSLHHPLKYARPEVSWNIFYHIDRKIVPTNFIT